MTATQVKAFIPLDITDAMLVSSNLSEPDATEPAWAAGTYAEFAKVSVITANSHQVFESLVSGNTDNPIHIAAHEVDLEKATPTAGGNLSGIADYRVLAAHP